MKLKLLSLSLAVLAFASGCMGTKNDKPAPNNTPEGTFSGRFKYTHVQQKTGAIDSLTANIQLQMESATGYKVTGDTSTLHAGSYGTYFVNNIYTGIEFIDKTFPTTGTPAKIHLSGIYSYTYDGSNLQMVAYGAFDTVSYYYNLKRTGN